MVIILSIDPAPSKKLTKEENKLSYAERKKAGIKKAFDLIDNNDKELLIKNKKHDDLTDCIIQAWAWFKSQK